MGSGWRLAQSSRRCCAADQQGPCVLCCDPESPSLQKAYWSPCRVVVWIILDGAWDART